MLDILKKHDPNHVRLTGGDGSVIVSPTLQGRIFCELGGELIHRLDVPLLKNPLPDEFNNLGGNSLWPAPEGGDFAFNYLPGSEAWVVQEGISDQPASVIAQDEQSAALEKTIRLKNRKGASFRVQFARNIRMLADDDLPEGTTFSIDRVPEGVKTVAYESTDVLNPLDECKEEEVLMAPWSLEQFPGGDGVLAFVKLRKPEHAINFDFYGMPEQPPVYGTDSITLSLGGKNRFQIGINVESESELLGAYDRARGLLFLRQTERQEGRYFNIADNDQPNGPWSAADMYSVFNGGDLNFFELETIAPLNIESGKVVASSLVSKTWIFGGEPDDLEPLMKDVLRISMA